MTANSKQATRNACLTSGPVTSTFGRRVFAAAADDDVAAAAQVALPFTCRVIAARIHHHTCLKTTSRARCRSHSENQQQQIVSWVFVVDVVAVVHRTETGATGRKRPRCADTKPTVRNQNAVSVGPRSSAGEKKREINGDREVLAGGAARAAGERVGVSLEAASPTLAEGEREREDGRERREKESITLAGALPHFNPLGRTQHPRCSSAAPPSSVEGGRGPA
jgi:hypothetical protein